MAGDVNAIYCKASILVAFDVLRQLIQLCALDMNQQLFNEAESFWLMESCDLWTSAVTQK